MTTETPRTRTNRLGRLRNPVTFAENVTRAVQQIVAGGRRYHLREPIDLTVRHSGPYSFVGYTQLAIEGYGKDEDEALESFTDVFSATWKAYAEEEDSRLSGDAIELKRRLRDLVDAVEPA
ncbi:MAG TPA: hypothetical protein VN924_03255 [Bryobacteraceae bacterium]|nr:hypothetical protein [Bryobacteraceae bacterium]